MGYLMDFLFYISINCMTLVAPSVCRLCCTGNVFCIHECFCCLDQDIDGSSYIYSVWSQVLDRL